MVGPNFTLMTALNAIKDAKPKNVILGTHHYVQLSESEELKGYKTEDLSSETNQPFFLSEVGPGPIPQDRSLPPAQSHQLRIPALPISAAKGPREKLARSP